MAIDTKNLGPIQAYQKLEELNANKTQKQNASNLDAEKATGLANAMDKVSVNVSKAEMRIEQQASLISHLFGNGQTTEQSSLKMTYQSAIEKINEILMADQAGTENTEEAQTPQNINPYQPISEEALQQQGGMDYWTPENTAKRIVQGATGFFEGFKNAHPELEGEQLMSSFMDIVGGGLTQGFEEAKGILDELNVLSGDIATNIDTTYQLVQDGMQAFQKDFLADLASLMGPTENETPA